MPRPLPQRSRTWTRPGDIAFVHAARALAAFQTVAFRSDASPFDAALAAGDLSVLPAKAAAGAALFYGKAGCAGCHAGPLLTDHGFHAIAMPQIGPGKGHGADTTYFAASGFPDRLEDEGRFRVTFDPADLFRFRTPVPAQRDADGPLGSWRRLRRPRGDGAPPSRRDRVARRLRRTRGPPAPVGPDRRPTRPRIEAAFRAAQPRPRRGPRRPRRFRAGSRPRCAAVSQRRARSRR